MGLLMKCFQPPVKRRNTDVVGIAYLPSMPELSYNECDAAEETDDSSDMAGVQGKPQISPKQTEFSLKQFAKRMGQSNYTAFNKRKKVWVARLLEMKHHSII